MRSNPHKFVYSEYINNRMTIHEYTPTLEETDVSANIVTNEPNTNAEDIHADENDVITATPPTHAEEIRIDFNSLRRKMLMNNARTKHMTVNRPISVPNAKQMIKSGRINKRNIIPQSPTEFMKTIQRPNKCLTPMPHRIYESRDIRGDVGAYRNVDLSEYEPATVKKAEAPVVEKPKDVNLAEIITSALQDVLAGKINTVDNIISKLRTDFEEKSMFTNALKKPIVVLNFEDDTARPVLQIEKQYMSIINDWYTQCDLLLDVEETHASIPETIIDKDIRHVLFQDINVKFKDEYLNNYLPLAINNIISQRSMKSFEKQHFKPRHEEAAKEVKPSYVIECKGAVDKIDAKGAVEYALRDLGVVVPANMCCAQILGEPQYAKQAVVQNTHICETPDLRNRVDPSVLYKKNIPHDTSIIDEMVVDNAGIQSYNADFNVLSPCFGEACGKVEKCDNQNDAAPKNAEIRTNICVLINDKFLHTITLANPSVDAEHIITNHPEFGFIQLFKIGANAPDVVHFIEKEFNHIQFNSIDEINAKLQLTSQYIEFANKHTIATKMVSSEETQVKQLLQSSYTIDTDIAHKMKASTLHDIIVNSGAVKIDADKMAGFKTRLSVYLKDLGLQKKRYNDGYYYYGIVEKENGYMSNPLSYPKHTREFVTICSVEDIVKERVREYESWKDELKMKDCDETRTTYLSSTRDDKPVIDDTMI